MSELKQLEENARNEYVKQRYEEIAVYIADLMEVMVEAFVDSRRAMLLEVSTMVTMVIAVIFTDGLVSEFAEVLFLLVMFRNWIYVHPRLHETMAELNGCFNVLEMLGMLERDSDDAPRRKLKKYKESQYAKMWEAIKSKKRQEAIA